MEHPDVLQPLQVPLKQGSKHPLVVILQQQLIGLGFGLPRFGADGVLGSETLSAYGAFLISQGLRGATDDRPKTITPAGAAALDRVFQALPSTPLAARVVDERANHPHSGRSVSKPFRRWNKISAIVLHQTASHLGESAKRWHSVPIHFGVTRNGSIIQLYDLTEVCNHAGALNRHSVGIEIDGWYAGIEGDASTLWQPRNGSARREAMDLPVAQAEAAKCAIQLIVDTVAANAGKITHIHPHRQSSKDRRSDPGSLIWRELGIWAQTHLGLSDGGAGFKVGDGTPIPKQWDDRYSNIAY